MINAIRDFFNWRKNPGNVFWIVIPLALFGFMTMLGVAILAIKLDGDWACLWIWLGAVALLCVGLYHPIRALRRMGAL